MHDKTCRFDLWFLVQVYELLGAFFTGMRWFEGKNNSVKPIQSTVSISIALSNCNTPRFVEILASVNLQAYI